MEHLTVTILERQKWTSYSACGIPYWVAGQVDGPERLVVRSAEVHRSRGLVVRTRNEATAIDTDAQTVTAHDLAVMGATLADGGVNPLTGERVMPAELCHHVLAVMLVAGLYETSGAWLYRVGLPAKSGIGGGIVTVSPGKGGLGTYAPRLDAQGNSVRGQKAARFLSFRLGLDLLASRPAP